VGKRLGAVAASLVFAGCFASSVVGVPEAAASSATITVSRTSGLLNGQLVSVSGSGFAPGDLAEVVECSNVPGQPTVSTFGFAIPVSCSLPINGAGYPFSVVSSPTVGSDGTVSTPIVVHTGVVGPPTLGIDSAGHNTAADAAQYPCPPTPSQQAQGASCELTLGDVQGDSASVPISFGAPVATAPSITASPSGGLSSGDQVSVSGAGFTPGSPWLASECNLTPGEPSGQGGETNLPIGCAQPVPGASSGLEPGPGPPVPAATPVTDSSGAMGTTLTIDEGNLGGTQQSAAYPCPPSPANLAAGGVCAVVVQDGADEEVSAAIAITGPIPVPSVNVSPSTGLSGNTTVQVTGHAFAANQLAGVLECNVTTGEPTVSYDGIQVPVGCSVPQLVSISDSGDLSQAFEIIEGETGPPSDGIDSAGNSSSADAASYPCPPTAAQQAEGSTCDVAVGDLEGDMAVAPISFATLPACTGASGNTAFVCALYEDLLGRAPDAPGLALWQSQLAGGTSRSQVASMLLASQEYRTDLVEGYYQSFLGRPADPSGISSWVGALSAGASDQSVIEGLLGSDEFYSGSGSAQIGFVFALYEDLLGRPPDPQGVLGWSTQIAAGTSRTAVVGAFLSSGEYMDDFVNLEYAKLLGRPADPAGLSMWVTDLEGGASYESVIAGICGSAEYYSSNS